MAPARRRRPSRLRGRRRSRIISRTCKLLIIHLPILHVLFVHLPLVHLPFIHLLLYHSFIHSLAFIHLFIHSFIHSSAIINIHSSAQSFKFITFPLIHFPLHRFWPIVLVVLIVGVVAIVWRLLRRKRTDAARVSGDAIQPEVKKRSFVSQAPKKYSDIPF